MEVSLWEKDPFVEAGVYFKGLQIYWSMLSCQALSSFLFAQ